MKSGWRKAGFAGVLLAAAPLAAQAIPFGSPFGDGIAIDDHARSVDCLATAIAYEAGLEPLAGQQAVAEVVMNRVHDAAFPKTVCGVVYQGSERRTGCQFTFTCDGSLLRRRLPDRMLAAARTIAADAIDGALPELVPGATFYHAYYVAPRWAPQLTRVSQIGAHIFYRAGQGQAIDSARPPFGDPVRAADAAMALRRTKGRARETFSPWGLPLPTTTAASGGQSGGLN